MKALPAIATIVFAVFLSLASGLQLLAVTNESPKPLDSDRIAINRNTVDRCIGQDPSFCIGSFVALLNGDILKVSRCSKNCPPYEMDIGQLMEYPPNEQFLNEIATIVLKVEHQQWILVKKRYERQHQKFLQSRT
ncbi:MAG: hypothetical protein NT108_01595 [Candidatus Kaiserbacteria bacterium]|nr:hypothetical protein [Candidatus Kaiserbacteria bacterium]